MSKRADETGGYRHLHTIEELRAYRGLSAETKLEWLHAMWMLNVDFLSPRARALHERFRRGDI